jgi:hypothetical protein
VSLSTASKDFKIKNGLIVQGSSATVNGNQVLTTASSIDDLSDVDTDGVSDGDSLVYSTTTQTWIPVAVSGGEGSASDSFKTISVSGQDNVVADSSTDTLTLVAGGNVTITTNASTDSITIAATDTDNNTTYSVSAETVTGGANLRLTGSDATTDDVKIQGSGLVTITRTDADTITVDANLDVIFNEQTASYTIALADKNKIIEINSASINDIIIPLDATTNFPIGAQVNVLQTGTGQTTVVGTSGVTVNGTPGLNLRAQWSAVTLIKRATDSWVAIGDLSE